MYYMYMLYKQHDCKDVENDRLTVWDANSESKEIVKHSCICSEIFKLKEPKHMH